MKRILNWPWEKIKPAVEIVAVTGAALFALFTWGIDALRLSAPNWAVSFGIINEYTAVVDDDHVRICSKADCKKASACVVQSKVITKNEARTPLNVGMTKIHFYIFDKDEISGFVDQSSYNSFKSICAKNTSEVDCPIAFGEVEIGPVDSQPLYPGQESWRPFTVEISPNKFDIPQNLETFAMEKKILIVAKQQVMPDSIWPWASPQESTATYLLSNLCHKGNYHQNNQCACDEKCNSMQPTAFGDG